MLDELPIVEREREVALIRRGLQQTRQGRGCLLVIEGPSGIGKSRLIAEADRVARASGHMVFAARSSDIDHAYAFGVVIDLFRSLLTSNTIQDLDLLRGNAKPAGSLLQDPGMSGEPLTVNREQSLLHSLYWFIVNLSEHGPVALIIDDIHWSDAPSLRLMNYLAHRLGDLPLMILVATRTGDSASEPDLVTRLIAESEEPILALKELSVRGTADMLSSAFGTIDNRAFIDACWKTTRGNPFLVRELLAEMNADPTIWEQPDLASWVQSHTPHSLGRNVMLRLRQLGDDAVILAQAFAVLGERPSLAVAAAMANLDASRAAGARGRLVAANILSAGDQDRFFHPMIRTTVYDRIDPSLRMQLHTVAASRLHRIGSSSEIVAGHLLRGTPISPPWAITALHNAARAAARKASPQTAVEYLRHAVELCDGHREASLLIDLGVYEAAAGETTALSRFEAAMSLLDDQAERNRAIHALGQTLYRYGRHDEAATVFRRGVELAHDDESKLVFEGAFMCAAQYVVALRPELRRRLNGHYRLENRTPTSTADHVLLANLALDSVMTVDNISAGAARTIAHRVLSDQRLLAEEGPDSMANNLATLALLWAGDHRAAQDSVEATLRDARQRGSILAFAEASMVRAFIMYTRGHLTEAIADAQTAIRGMDDGWRSAVPAPQAVLASCLIERGDLQQAQKVLLDTEPLAKHPAMRGMTAWYHAAHGRLQFARGNYMHALDDFVTAGDRFDEYLEPVSPALIPWRSLASTAAASLGKSEYALELVSQEEQLARKMNLPMQIGRALRVGAALDLHQPPVPILREAVSILETADAQLELAYALFELGRVELAAGSVLQAREVLRRALDTAYSCGAITLAENARTELIRSGARPRRHTLTGASSLTPSEKRIAERAAAGQTSREIAEDLFLSKNTVEWHLRRIHRKLGVTSRTRIREKLEEIGDVQA